MQRGLLTGIFLGLLMAIFALQNGVMVPVKILWIKFNEVPLALMVMIPLFLGVAITALFGFLERQKLRAKIKRMQNTVAPEETHVNPNQAETDLVHDDVEFTVDGQKPHHFFDD